MLNKVCTKCHILKNISEFYKHKLGKYNVDSTCKECKSIYKKNRWKKYKKKISKRISELRKKNIQHVLEIEKEYRNKNREKLRKYEKNWAIKNPEKVKLKAHKWYQKNKKRICKQKRIFYIENKEFLNKKRAEYHTIKRNNDIRYKIKGNLRTRLSMALSGYSKALSTMFLIGCDLDYLMFYLQEQFIKEMNWDNYGREGWEIDHIKPCASFDLSKTKEQRKCFHYTNLQPLWVTDNRKKGKNETI